MPILIDNMPVNPAVPTASGYIVDVDTKNFMAEVIESSKRHLVLVDFWAPWCGPCKLLVPMLEKLVAAYNGAVRLAKINIDANAQIATQMRVQSVPTVFAFYQGQPVDGFSGGVGEPQLKSWVDRLVSATGVVPPGEKADSDLEDALAHGEGALAEGDIDTARLIFTDLLKRNPMEARAFAGQLRCLIAEGKIDMASEILNQAHETLRKSKEMAPIRTALDLANEARSKAGALHPLLQALESAPDNHQARFDLAMAHYAAGDTAAALETLLSLVQRDRQWDDGAARKQLLKFFEILGPSDPLTVQFRKRLSSVLFS